MNKQYETEVRERFGNTEAYREYGEKTKGYSKDKWEAANEGLLAIFAKLSECRNSGAAPDSDEVQALVLALQTHITENYYACTDEILSGFSETYVCDERFKKNIDKYGEGTAEFARDAIRAFCK